MQDVESYDARYEMPWWCGIVMKNVAYAMCSVVVWCRMWKMMQCVVRCGGVM